jgi:hypothetical protein
MAEGSFVKSLTRAQATGAEEETAWRKAFWIDNTGGGSPFSVALRYRDGRLAEGFSPGLYLRHVWLDRGGKVERIVWIFSHGGIYLEGMHLQRGLDALEEGRLKRIYEQGESEIKLVESRNLDIRKPEDKEPIVSRLVVSPSWKTVIKSDENLVEIAKAMKEDL